MALKSTIKLMSVIIIYLVYFAAKKHRKQLYLLRFALCLRQPAMWLMSAFENESYLLEAIQKNPLTQANAKIETMEI